MKNTLLATAVVSFISTLNANAIAYPLMCKGGSPEMTGIFGTYKDGEAVGHTITVKFKKGNVGGAPGPGECVWVNRRIYENEPSEFRYSKLEWEQTYSVSQEGLQISFGPLKYLVDGIAVDSGFTVQAHNSNLGYFLVHALGEN